MLFPANNKFLGRLSVALVDARHTAPRFSAPMGLDGGTIISRSDILRGQSWEVANSDGGASTSSRGGQLSANKVHTGRRRADPAAQRRARWSHCALSGEPLREPIVCCGLGRLYNREALIEHALAAAGTFVSERSTYAYANRLNASVAGGGASHVRSLRDFFPVYLKRVAGDAVDTEASNATPEFECPVWGTRCGDPRGGEFVAIRPCGHVVSDRARRDAEALTGDHADAGGVKRTSGEGDGRRGREGPRCPACDARFDVGASINVNSFDARIIDAARAEVDARRSREDEARAEARCRRERKRARKEGGGSAAVGVERSQ